MNVITSRNDLKPIVQEIDGVFVVRDDLHPGGTKARFIFELFRDADELVYASPCEGGAQYALAYCARELGKRATIFCAKRGQPHARSLQAKALGATIYQVSPGYLAVARARAATYAKDMGARLLPFGLDMPLAIDRIADAARRIDIDRLAIDEIWCAAGSGVLSRGLAQAWPAARINRVQIGHKLEGAIPAPWPFGHALRQSEGGPPFPSDPHYDAKAWAMMRRQGRGRLLFWNCAGPAQ